MNGNPERVADLLRLADKMDVDGIIEFFAADAVMEFPFAPGRMETRYEGKEAILGFQLFARDSFSEFHMFVDAIYETADPHVVIAEHHSAATVAANGRPYNNKYVTIFTFGDDGLLARWREYYDPRVVVKAFRAGDS